MSEILDEYGNTDGIFHKILKYIRPTLRYVIATICVAMFAFYVGNMMFGKRSLDVMLSLQSKKDRLSEDVEILKKMNARLQKDYKALSQTLIKSRNDEKNLVSFIYICSKRVC